jgi:hypothetical protein
VIPPWTPQHFSDFIHLKYCFLVQHKFWLLWYLD